MKKEYSGECFSAFEAGYNIGYRQAQRDFKSLIERDKPKKPICKQGIEDDREIDDYCCPNCFCDDILTLNFCHKCGQRLDWNK